MSDSPPPFGEDETKVDAVAASSTIDIDLNDDKPSSGGNDTDEISVGNSASNTNTTSRHNNDDLFFSTISDPEPNIEVYLGGFFFFLTNLKQVLSLSFSLYFYLSFF